MRKMSLKKSVRNVFDVVVKLAVSLSVFAFAIAPLLAQNPASEKENARKSMSFDAVSIRPADPNSKETPEGGLEGNTLTIRNSPLTFVVTRAFYDRGKVPSGFVDSLPKWVREDRFDLIAKISASDYESLKRETHQSDPVIPAEMLQPMLQNMLKERCNLAVHHEKGVLHGFSLEIGGKGINPKNLKVAAAPENVPSEAHSFGGAWRSIFVKGEDGQNDKRIFYNMTMREFASHVSSAALTTDNTGLTARYDFSVELIDSAHDISERYDVSPLGLKWRRMDIATDKVVIDHLDRPSQN